MQVDLNGKVALVTGAARGIGRTISDMLAQNGATVIYSDREDPQNGAYGNLAPPARAIKLDVTNQDDIAAAISLIEREYGGLDILVNNAGVNTIVGRVTFDQYPIEEWERILSVDLTGVFLVARAAAQAMLRRGGGRIINITSVLGLVPARLQCAYVASKAGVANLTKAMAIELGSQGILVNGVAPGSVLTEATKQLFYGDDGSFRASMQGMLDHIPLGRPGNPEDIANAVLFLAAPENGYVNGHILTVDGGWTAGYIRDF